MPSEAGRESEFLSVRAAAFELGASRSEITSSCLILGVIVRPVGRAHAIRRSDLDLLRARLDQRSSGVPA